jgi:hypothetical protein
LNVLWELIKIYPKKIIKKSKIIKKKIVSLQPEKKFSKNMIITINIGRKYFPSCGGAGRGLHLAKTLIFKELPPPPKKKNYL